MSPPCSLVVSGELQPTMNNKAIPTNITPGTHRIFIIVIFSSRRRPAPTVNRLLTDWWSPILNTRKACASYVAHKHRT